MFLCAIETVGQLQWIKRSTSIFSFCLSDLFSFFTRFNFYQDVNACKSWIKDTNIKVEKQVRKCNKVSEIVHGSVSGNLSKKPD